MLSQTDKDYIERIWASDLLNRRADGEKLHRYLVNRSRKLATTFRNRAIVLAVDAPYGAGKSDFIRKICDQITLSHPTAFIDAWADDTSDSPWAALVVAIDEALQQIRDKIAPTAQKLLAERGVNFVKCLAKGFAKQTIKRHVDSEAYDEAVDALFDRHSIEFIDEFLERKKSIDSMKEALRDLLSDEFLSNNGPIFIFVDELDRCRPNYAISFLEQIKHFFDISGIVFVLSVHSEQLEKSISSVYGREFNAKDYLRRFIDQYYILPQASPIDLVRYYTSECKLDLSRFGSPQNDDGDISLNLDFISKSFEYWDLQPRNIIRVIDRLSTFQDVWNFECLIRLEFVIPLMIRDVMRIDVDELYKLPKDKNLFSYRYQKFNRQDSFAQVTFAEKTILEIFQRYNTMATQSSHYLTNRQPHDEIEAHIKELSIMSQSAIGTQKTYIDLLRSYQDILRDFSTS